MKKTQRHLRPALEVEGTFDTAVYRNGRWSVYLVEPSGFVKEIHAESETVARRILNERHPQAAIAHTNQLFRF